jgi:hypothetical protein
MLQEFTPDGRLSCGFYAAGTIISLRVVGFVKVETICAKSP